MGTLLIVGSDRKGNLESSYAKAFRQLGWAVHFWDPQAALRRFSRGAKLGEVFSKFVNVEPWLRKANLELLEVSESLRPELILVIATEGVRAGTLAQLRVQRRRPALYCIFPDTPHNLVPDRIQSLPFFDRVFTVSPAWASAFELLGAKRVEYLPLAADTELHSPVAGNSGASPFSKDVTFIGNWRADREKFLEQLTDFDLGVWGSVYWKRHTQPGARVRSYWGGRQLVGEEFAHACGQSKILLNIIDGVGWPGPNMRAFELLACRAFCLGTRTPAISELFVEGETVECFDSVEEARDKIKYYLNHDSERERIAAAGYELVVRGGHTYVDRARKLTGWLKEDGLS